MPSVFFENDFFENIEPFKNQIKKIQNIQKQITVCLYLLARNVRKKSEPKPPPKLSYRSAIHKKVVFSPDQFGPWPERKGKSGRSGASWRHLEASYTREKNYTYQNHIWTTTFVSKKLVLPTLLGGP